MKTGTEIWHFAGEKIDLRFLPQQCQISVPLFIEIGTCKGTFHIQVLFKMFIVICFYSLQMHFS